MLHPPRPAIEAWVTAQGLGILHGRAQVAETIRQLAAGAAAAGSEHAKIIRKTLTYLDAKERTWTTPAPRRDVTS